jgi:hypothetical protein
MKIFTSQTSINFCSACNKELVRVFDKLPKYHMKISVRDFNAKVSRETIFKPTIWNETLYAISNDNGARVVNFTSPKI